MRRCHLCRMPQMWTDACIRTQSFLYLNVTILLSELTAPAMGSLLMKRLDPHVAFVVALPILASGFVVLLFMHEERPAKPSASSSETASSESSDIEATSLQKVKRTIKNMLSFIRHDIGAVLGEAALLLGITALAIQKLARPLLEFLLQYMSKKFDWPISDVSREL